MRTRTFVAIAIAAAIAGCSRKSDEQRGGPPPRSGGAGSAPATLGGSPPGGAKPDSAEAARLDRNAELQAQQAQQQPQGTAQAHEVSGRVVTASDRELVLARDDGVKPDLHLRIAPGATITVGGKTGRAEDLREGTPVRAAYQAPEGTEGVPTAIRIVAEPQGTATGAPHGSAGERGGADAAGTGRMGGGARK